MKKIVLTLSALGLLTGSMLTYAANTTNTMNNTMPNNAANPTTNTTTNTAPVNPGNVNNANTVANAQKPMSQWICEDFLVLDATVRPNAIIYGTALDAQGREEAIFDVTGTEQVVPYVIQECTREPKSSFMEKVRNAWDRVKNDVRR